jgi:hypothetical protein
VNRCAARSSQAPPRPRNEPAPSGWKHTTLAGAVVAALAVTLFAMGRLPICRCGYVKAWHGVVLSAENSQHVTDWYTPSHVIHGFAFFGMLWLIASRWPIGRRLVAAALIESGWEIFESTDFVINRYRSVTIALDYYGDSILNSVSDVLAMMGGFALAARLPVAVTIGLTVALEAFVAWSIRDNLTLNIIMLQVRSRHSTCLGSHDPCERASSVRAREHLYPLESIRRWQSGG